MKQFKLMVGDNIASLKKLPDNSIDSVVTDPPYGLSFMGKKWDYDIPSIDLWKEVYRVLKPGGHLLSFGGTRTYHRMVVNIEDAGFEIRDQIMWIYGSGFPKSHNIGKAVDKIQGNEREVVGERLVLDMTGGNYKNTFDKTDKQFDITKGSSPHEGWGTAIKPANEPICVARKPLSEKTIADNVLKWGTGGINIDGCRIGSDMVTTQRKNNQMDTDSGKIYSFGLKGDYIDEHEGRFPANIIFDEIAGEMLDEQSGISKPSKGRTGIKGGSPIHQSKMSVDVEGHWPADNGGGASRFFYIPKVSKAERNMGLDGFEEKYTHTKFGTIGNRKEEDVVAKNNHPTLKPVQLMAYLVRLVTPPNGIVLDPFMGSGSTGISTLLEGFRFCGMEMDKEYFKIAESRIENYELYRPFTEKKKKKC